MLSSLVLAHAGVAGAVRCALLVCGVSAQQSPGIPDGFREAWLALLHYWGDGEGWLSEVEDPSFFLDAEGSRSPEREWIADRRAFLLPVDELGSERHAQCRFPARLALMKDALGWADDGMRIVDCPDLATHERTLSAESLSVVFVSHYLSNPASAFGHIMLYLGSGSERSAVLADYSVSFEADTEGMSPAEYLPRGLFGGLVAGFRLAPLHERVRKYERQEQRDLWMFPIQLKRGEVDQLVRHLWELRELTFDYGFFGGNCAQKILALVHAVAPQYELLPYGTPAVLPQEVGRRLVEKVGLAGALVQRPSLLSQYRRQLAELSPEERGQLEEMVASHTLVEGASPATLSAALVWSELEMPHRAFQPASETADQTDVAWRRALWASRVRRGTTTEGIPTGEVQSFEPSFLQAHRPSRVTLRGGYQRDGGSMVGAGARWLLHGPLDPNRGYPSVSSVEIARIEFDVSATAGINLEEVTAVRVEKLGPASGLESALAWRLEVGARRLAHQGEAPLHVGAEFGVGVGAARSRPNYSVAVYSMVGVRPGLGLMRDGASFLPAALGSIGLLVRLPTDIRTRVSGEYSASLSSLEGSGTMLHAVLRKGLAQDWDVELAVTAGPGRSAFTLGLVSFR